MFKNKKRNASDNFEFPMYLGTCLDINTGNTYSIATQCGQMS